MRVVLSTEARTDYRQILEYSAQTFGRRRAAQTAAVLEYRLHNSLGKQPRSGRLRPEFGPAVRSSNVSPFVIFYELQKSRVFVLRILHGRRDIHAPLISLLLAS